MVLYKNAVVRINQMLNSFLHLGQTLLLLVKPSVGAGNPTVFRSFSLRLGSVLWLRKDYTYIVL